MGNLSGFVKRLRDIMRNDAGINGDAQRIEQITWLLFLKVYDAKEQDWTFDDENYQSIIPEDCRWASWAHDDKSGSAMTGDTLLDFVNNTLFPVLKGTDIKDSKGEIKIKGVKVDASTPIRKAIVQSTFADANNYMKDGVLLRQVINVIDELDLSDYEESHAFGEIYETILKELQSAGSSGEFYTPRAVTDFMAQMIRPRIGERMADFACGTGGFLVSWLKELQKQVESTAGAKKYGESIYGIEKKQFPYMLCITNLLLHDLDVPRVYHENSLLKDVLDYTEDDQFEVILMPPLWRQRESRREKTLPQRPGQQRDRRPVPVRHHVPAGEGWAGRRHPARRVPVWHGQRKGQHQKETAGRVQSAHRYPYAIQRVLSLHLHYYQHSIF